MPACVHLVITVVIVKNWSLTNRHSNDRAAMLVCASRTPITVTALRSEQNGGNVVDLMCGLGTCTLLGDTATLAPSMAGIQHKGEKED